MDIFGILYPIRENNAVSLALDFISPRSNKIYGVAVRCYYNHCNGYFSVHEKKASRFAAGVTWITYWQLIYQVNKLIHQPLQLIYQLTKLKRYAAITLPVTAMMFSVHKKRYRLRYENPRVTVGAKLASESVSGGFSSLNAFVYKRCHSSW